jgi:hypothetical protein
MLTIETMFQATNIRRASAEDLNRSSVSFGLPALNRLITLNDPELLLQRWRANTYKPRKKCPIKAAIKANGWDPLNPGPLKKGHYLDPKELFYRVCKIQLAGSIQKAGRDGDRFVELCYLLAQNYLGKVLFRDQGAMSNMADDIIQEAATKCSLIVLRFRPWADYEAGKLNNAFAYFTTVSKNRSLETLTSPLSGSSLYLEDLKTEGQSVSDLI